MYYYPSHLHLVTKETRKRENSVEVATLRKFTLHIVYLYHPWKNKQLVRWERPKGTLQKVDTFIYLNWNQYDSSRFPPVKVRVAQHGNWRLKLHSSGTLSTQQSQVLPREENHRHPWTVSPLLSSRCNSETQNCPQEVTWTGDSSNPILRSTWNEPYAIQRIQCRKDHTGWWATCLSSERQSFHPCYWLSREWQLHPPGTIRPFPSMSMWRRPSLREEDVSSHDIHKGQRRYDPMRLRWIARLPKRCLRLLIRVLLAVRIELNQRWHRPNPR